VPSTAHSMVSLLLSAYPPHSFRILTREFPRIRLPSLSSELEERGYRTAFFNAADNRFQRARSSLRRGGSTCWQITARSLALTRCSSAQPTTGRFSTAPRTDAR